MVKIRLKRFGAKKNPHYRIVVIDVRRARDGAYIESLGSYNPRGAQTFTLDETRLEYWLGQGAQMTLRVKALRKRLARGEKPAAENASRVEASLKPEPEVKEEAKEESLKVEATEETQEETKQEGTKTEATTTEGGSDEGSA